jgi:hypothetical protein
MLMQYEHSTGLPAVRVGNGPTYMHSTHRYTAELMGRKRWVSPLGLQRPVQRKRKANISESHYFVSSEKINHVSCGTITRASCKKGVSIYLYNRYLILTYSVASQSLKDVGRVTCGKFPKLLTH